jgi:CheY-like chemotaxis protein
MTDALTGVRLLLVEDETMVAMMVEDLLVDLGCVVVDVAGTLSRGLALASDADLRLDGAILDVNLGGEKVYPVAEALAARGVPFIFATGYGIAGISETFSHVPALAKPYDQRALEQMLTAAIRGSAESGRPPPT